MLLRVGVQLLFRDEQSAEPRRDLHPLFMESSEQKGGRGLTGIQGVGNAKGRAVSPWGLGSPLTI